jgi:simple sugar transport system ATP-binding protein
LSDLTIPEKLHQVNLTVRQSEIVGIAGVSGNGQTTLFDVISGLTTPSQGIVRFYGKQVQPATPAGIIRAGVARIPEDRQQTGLIGDMNLWENLILETHSAPTFGHRGWLKRRSAQIYADRIIQQFDVRGATTTTPVRLLSGGNMQKLILGRVLAAQPRLIVASQPTRGLDLGAVTEVHQRLLAARSNGAGILLISEDLDELLTLCDRIYVLYRGNLSDSWPIEQVNLQELGLRMTGTISP